jgi:hypothetical protein
MKYCCFQNGIDKAGFIDTNLILVIGSEEWKKVIATNQDGLLENLKCFNSSSQEFCTVYCATDFEKALQCNKKSVTYNVSVKLAMNCNVNTKT